MKYQPKLARTFIAFALIGCLSITEAKAQETCSLDDVSNALNQLPCVADGVYLSPLMQTLKRGATNALIGADASSCLGSRRSPRSA